MARSSSSDRRSRCRAATRSWSGAARARDSTHHPVPRDAETQTALYQYKAGTAGTWIPGPEIPTIDNEEYASTDGPGATLPDGNVLFDASACTYNIPTHFFVYNASSNTLTQIPDAPNAENDTSYQTRMLVLPNGQVLYNDGSSEMEVYTAGGNAEPGVGALDQIAERHQPRPRQHVQPVRKAARRA